MDRAKNRKLADREWAVEVPRAHAVFFKFFFEFLGQKIVNTSATETPGLAKSLTH